MKHMMVIIALCSSVVLFFCSCGRDRSYEAYVTDHGYLIFTEDGKGGYRRSAGVPDDCADTRVHYPEIGSHRGYYHRLDESDCPRVRNYQHRYRDEIPCPRSRRAIPRRRSDYSDCCDPCGRYGTPHDSDPRRYMKEQDDTALHYVEMGVFHGYHHGWHDTDCPRSRQYHQRYRDEDPCPCTRHATPSWHRDCYDAPRWHGRYHARAAVKHKKQQASRGHGKKDEKATGNLEDTDGGGKIIQEKDSGEKDSMEKETRQEKNLDECQNLQKNCMDGCDTQDSGCLERCTEVYNQCKESR